MKQQEIADITFKAWRLAMDTQDQHKATIYENHLLALGYLPLCVKSGYTLLQEKTPLSCTLPYRYHKAAHILRFSKQGHFPDLVRALDDVATCLYAYGREITFAWIDQQLPYHQEFYPHVARMLSHVKAHLLRNPREKGE